MKKISTMAAAGILLLSACVKKDIATNESLYQTISSNATTVDLSKCKIRRIYQVDFNGLVSALFSYNSLGNPYSVLYSDGGTGVDDHFFFYDAKNRLKQYDLTWVGYLHEQHFYSHNQKDQIVKDSAIYRDCCGRTNSISVSTIEYDLMGRVVKEIITNKYNAFGPAGGIYRPTYTYDSRGNLAVRDWKSSSYDYKVNPLRQSPVFQFVFRNYSMNNAAVQPKYNSLGLPLSIKPSNDYFFNEFETVKIIYDCQ